ncbi:MAG: phosphoribosylanthranilate isomerase [Granulosicoccus sp.]
MARRTRVKICGITRLNDAHVAQELGVDSLGFVFVPASSRYLPPKDAAEITSQLSPFVNCVGLFLNATATEVRQALDICPGLLPQFHGQESAEYCDQFGRPYLKAIGVGSGMPAKGDLAAYRHASGFLFDSNEAGELGGTGHAFDWNILEHKIDKPLILAGGLNVQNVRQAIEQVAPHAVDVSTGVESAKGIKSEDAMREFMRAVNITDAAINATKQT